MKYGEFAKRAFFDKIKMPVYLIFFVTNRCNARCNHCFYWQKTSSKSNELTLEEIETMTRNMEALHHVNLTGGEPFLRDDLSDIVGLFYKHCRTKSFGIPTNGYSPQRICDTAEKILKECPDIMLQIGVSFDHLSSVHDRIRNCESLFDHAVETVMSLKKMKAKGLIVGVNFTLTTENEKDIEKIYHFLSTVLRPDMISPLLVRGLARVPSTKDVSPENYKKLLSLWMNDSVVKIMKDSRSSFLNRLVSHRDIVVRRMIAKWLEGKKCRLPCTAGTLAAVVYEDGEVCACELLSESFGNLRDHNYDFKSIWSSQKAADFTKKIKRNKCWCTHECFQGMNTVFTMGGIMRIAKNMLTTKLA